MPHFPFSLFVRDFLCQKLEEFMNESEHAFPLPEREQVKLNEVKDEILHPISRRIRRYTGENTWKLIAVSVLAGAVCGWALGQRG